MLKVGWLYNCDSLITQYCELLQFVLKQFVILSQLLLFTEIGIVKLNHYLKAKRLYLVLV